ncbi:MAG: RNA polymerase sigma factor [Kiritimatiellia bacterium]
MSFSDERQVGWTADRDADLMLEVADGSEEAFAELIRRHQDSLLNFFVRMGAHYHAEDLVQETFLRIFRWRKRYRPTARFRTFLYVVARHVWVDNCRRLFTRERLT